MTVKHSDLNSDEENDTNSLKSEKINENDLKSMDSRERKRVCNEEDKKNTKQISSVKSE
jgi:uncharacterized protein YaaW (UPF0174 family)